ncbi:MAG: cytochrome c biogenesis protein CcsA [Planctomycetes bacterium]|nr:cytochrome c biogenesis protein CcsA [Planctomycetota bacterium]
MNRLIRACCLLLVLAWAAPLSAQHDHSEPGHDHASHAGPSRTVPWTKEIVELAESLPVQDGGRVKPLHTFAGFTLLRMNGKRSVKTPTGELLSPTEWLLDLLFFPDLANTYAMFRVDDIAAIREIGGPTEGKQKRDRWSYSELHKHTGKLFDLANTYSQIDEKARDSVQTQVVALAHNVDEYIRVSRKTAFAQSLLPVGAGDGLTKIFGGREQVRFSEVIDHVDELRALQGDLDKDPARAAEQGPLTELLQRTVQIAEGSEAVAMFPPTVDAKAQPAWYSPSDLLMSAFAGDGRHSEHVAMLGFLEKAMDARGDMGEFHKSLAGFAGEAKALARARGEYEKIGLELVYYKSKLLDYSHYGFVLGFLLVAFLWMWPQSKWLYRVTALSAGFSVAAIIAVIVMRCMIRERPPVSTLYETLLFVTGVGTLAALVMEAINRRKLALSAAVVLGTLGIFLANRYEELDKRDTMPELVAVLDTNFWLATHVTSITIGYSAGMLAALLANVYLVSRLFGIRKSDPTHLKSLSRMTYGALAFGLIFSVVGTILGGIWANDSWGRFWGWDPKENGALLICLSQIVILHLRMGGYLRDFGIAMATAFGGTVIAFSWFGVNLLGVGLHSYGFTSGIHTALWSYYIGQWGLMAICGVHFMIERAKQEAQSGATHAQQPAQAPHSTDGRTA